MKNSRPILGYISFKWSTNQIMNKLGWLSIHYMIRAESIKFVHRVTFENLPPAINEYLCYSVNREQNEPLCHRVRVKIHPKSAKMAQSLLYRAVFLYNKIDYELKTINPKKFSKKISQLL